MKIIRCFPKNKAWVNKDININLNRKKVALMSGDRQHQEFNQKELKRRLRRMPRRCGVD